MPGNVMTHSDIFLVVLCTIFGIFGAVLSLVWGVILLKTPSQYERITPAIEQHGAHCDKCSTCKKNEADLADAIFLLNELHERKYTWASADRERVQRFLVSVGALPSHIPTGSTSMIVQAQSLPGQEGGSI